MEGYSLFLNIKIPNHPGISEYWSEKTNCKLCNQIEEVFPDFLYYRPQADCKNLCRLRAFRHTFKYKESEITVPKWAYFCENAIYEGYPSYYGRSYNIIVIDDSMDLKKAALTRRVIPHFTNTIIEINHAIVQETKDRLDRLEGLRIAYEKERKEAHEKEMELHRAEMSKRAEAQRKYEQEIRDLNARLAASHPRCEKSYSSSSYSSDRRSSNSSRSSKDDIYSRENNSNGWAYGCYYG